MENFVGRVIRMVFLLAVLGVIVWVFTNPSTAANAIVGVIGGVFGFVGNVIDGISALFK